LAASDFRGTLALMKVRLDSAGRVVVPKALQHALGLRAGQMLEITARDGRLEIEAAATPLELRKRDNGPVAVPKTGKMPTLTSEQVRDTLERVRR
jgi:AbrB family looped-hinge helix DNA binding protein